MNQARIQQENQELERRYTELENELKVQRKQNAFENDRMQGIEQRYENVELESFLQRNQKIELEHLQRMVKIFEEENRRLGEIYASGTRPSEGDIVYIKSNIEQVRKEIDEILRARAQLNGKYNELVGVINSLRGELENQKKYGLRSEELNQIGMLVQ